jgi:hypothetical protein
VRLFATYYGQNRLYRNKGDGTFSDVTVKAGLLETSKRTCFGSGCTFVDYNRDGFLDLFVANYAVVVVANAPKPSLQMPNCHTKEFRLIAGQADYLCPRTCSIGMMVMDLLRMFPRSPASRL